MAAQEIGWLALRLTGLKFSRLSAIFSVCMAQRAECWSARDKPSCSFSGTSGYMQSQGSDDLLPSESCFTDDDHPTPLVSVSRKISESEWYV